MNDDTAPTERGCWVVAIRRVGLVVVNQVSAVAPDSDPELIRAASAGLVPVNARQHKTVVTTAIDRADAFVLSLLAAMRFSFRTYPQAPAFSRTERYWYGCG